MCFGSRKGCDGMRREIKTRQLNKEIRVLDKAGTISRHMRQTYVHTKDGIEQGQRGWGSDDISPTDYAGEKINNMVGHVVHESAHQAGRPGRKALNTIKKSRTSKGKEKVRQTISSEVSNHGLERVSHFFQDDFLKEIHQGEDQMRKRVQSKLMRDRFSNRLYRNSPQQMAKTSDQAEQAFQFIGRVGKAVKQSGAGTIKYARRTVKTAEQTAHMAIKTSQETLKSAKMTTRVSVKMTEKSMKAAGQATRQAIQAAERTARIAAKATMEAIKALIAATQNMIAALASGGGMAVFVLVMIILFGGILCMVGGDNSSFISPVSAEVEAYTPLIRQYANQYGIGEYVELIKAVMMQESGGQGADPMQSSEGIYNTRYPKEPNGITDPVYSIECGVQEIKAVLESAGVESPVDMEHIKLALQGYNFGNGYISWAKDNYGGYTIVNAAEFSDMMAQRMGWSSYGDKQYVPHVLRYYVFGRIPTGMGNQAIVQVALTQEGNSGETYWSWYGFGGRVEWCACFVSWCADQCGYIERGVIPKFSSCSAGVAWFEACGQFQDGSHIPSAGDLIFFDWGNTGSIDHVGIVENVVDGKVNTIEGNSSDRCARRSYVIGDDRIYGYGIPVY